MIGSIAAFTHVASCIGKLYDAGGFCRQTRIECQVGHDDIFNRVFHVACYFKQTVQV